MPPLDLSLLASPLSEMDPCGPDLDLAADEDYLNFMAIAEGVLPTQYFSDSDERDERYDQATKRFNPGTIDIEGQVARLAPLLRRTRDIKLLSVLARFLILGNDFAGFVTVIEAMGQLLDQHWDEVHPRFEGGTFAMRGAAIGTLNQPTVFFPLQFIPLSEDRRLGVVTYRAQLIASGDATALDGEAPLSQGAILQALREGDAQRIADLRELFERLRAALKRISAIFTEHGVYREAPSLEKIGATVIGVKALFDEAFPREEENAGPDPGEGQTTTRSASKIRSAAQARSALDAAIDYFRRHEPSSPVLPLISKSRELQGKTLIEIVQILMPNKADRAAYAIGEQQSFQLPLESLAEAMPLIVGYGEEEADETSDFGTYGSPQPAAAAQPPSAIDEGQQGVAEEAADGAMAEAALADASDPAASEETGSKDAPSFWGSGWDPPKTPAHPPVRPEAFKFNAETRKEAIFLLDEVARYLRVAEPSSPIPWLIDRAKALADKDFLSVLSSLMPG